MIDLRPVAASVYAELGPIQPDDDQHGNALAHLLAALFKPADDVDDIVGDRNGRDARNLIFDPVTAPAAWLPWLAQIAGVTLVPGESEDATRARVIAAAGRFRGTREALTAAAQMHLTGTRNVRIVERDGSPYRVTVVTRSSETPNAAAVLAAITSRTVKPAGLLVFHVVSNGQTWNEVAAGTSWDEVPAGVSWDEVASTPI